MPAAEGKGSAVSSEQNGGRPISLQRRFLMTVGFIFLASCFLIAFLIYIHEKRQLEESAHEKARLVMAAVEASRSYIREILRPKLYEILDPHSFLLEGMSTSYVGRAVMSRFNKEMPAYNYRRVAPGPRNPEFEPLPFEVELIDFFSADSDRELWQGIVTIENRSHFICALPVYYSRSCMHCHGNPEDAPAELREIYGDHRGFGHKEGTIAGLNTVRIPVDIALAKIRERAFSAFAVSFLCLSLLYALVCFFFNRVVIHSLRDLLEVFKLGLLSEEEMELLKEAKSKDEIWELTSAAGVMTEHLREARRKLAGYAEGLEKMVADRTEELLHSQRNLQEKVMMRNRELKGLTTIAELITRSDHLRDIFPRVLEQTLQLIPCKGAALYLLKGNPPILELQCHKNAEGVIESVPIDEQSSAHNEKTEGSLDMKASLRDAAFGRIRFFTCAREYSCLNVPLMCRGKVLGVMAFVGGEFRDASGEMGELMVSIGRQIGITIESLKNMEDLISSKELLQSVFEGITDMLVLFDGEGRIQMVNRAHLAKFGAGIEEVLGRRCGKELACESCIFDSCSLFDALETSSPMTEELSSRSGEIFLVHYYPIVNEAGEVGGIIRYAKNITETKKVEQRIQQTEKLVALGQLSAGIAHEINNPLGVILCYSDLLKQQLAGQQQGLNDVATIEKHARSCQRIVSDLLNFSRGQETVRKTTSLNEAVGQVIHLLGRQFERKRRKIEMVLDPELPDISIDVDQIKQVVLNLIMNAHQAMGNKGVIRVTTKYLPADKEVILEIWDNGEGIPVKIKDKIFDPFFSTKRDGTGLGLSVSYGIIQNHGGEIQVESRPGQWSRFTIVLPVDGRG